MKQQYIDKFKTKKINELRKEKEKMRRNCGGESGGSTLC